MRINTKASEPRSDKKRDKFGLMPHFTAYGHFYLSGDGCLNDSVQGSENGRVIGLIIGGHPFIGSIHRQQVLNKVVGPDGKKAASLANSWIMSNTAGSSIIAPRAGEG